MLKVADETNKLRSSMCLVVSCTRLIAGHLRHFRQCGRDRDLQKAYCKLGIDKLGIASRLDHATGLKVSKSEKTQAMFKKLEAIIIHI